MSDHDYDDDLDGLVGAIAPLEQRLLVLDFDGTLAPIVEDPDAAALADGAEDAIAAVAARTKVVVLSGRHVDDLAPRVGDLPVTLCGGHGTEVRELDGSRTPLFDHEQAEAALDAVETDVRAVLPDGEGWHVERKPASLAVHSRRVERPDAVLAEVRSAMERHTGRAPGWVVTDGKAVTELRPEGVDKGTALEWLADRDPDRAIVAIGDDITDEDTFEATNLRGGLSVLVAEEERATHATTRLATPARVVELLRRVADA